MSRDSGDYLRFLVGNVNHSTSVSLRFTCFNFISYILCFTLFTSSPRSGATALDGEYVSTDFLATSKGWFLVVFRIWRGTPFSLFIPIMSTFILVKTV